MLASKSAQRAALLRDAGFIFDQINPPFDDPPQPKLEGNQRPQDLAGELALKKAQSLKPNVGADRVILAADTLCVGTQGEVLGQPGSRAEADNMIRSFFNARHAVITGCALLHTTDGHFVCFADTAYVTYGEVSDYHLDQYLDSHAWQGKAGGYNLFDRQRDGWPIEVEGDPGTVVGLPMNRLVKLLPQLGVKPRMLANSGDAR